MTTDTSLGAAECREIDEIARWIADALRHSEWPFNEYSPAEVAEWRANYLDRSEPDWASMGEWVKANLPRHLSAELRAKCDAYDERHWNLVARTVLHYQYAKVGSSS
jgi:hypothetical protein